MAKESSLKEVWKEFNISNNPKLMKLADLIYPKLSIQEELDKAIEKKDLEKIIYINKSIKDHVGLNNTFPNDLYAYRALVQIRSYSSSN